MDQTSTRQRTADEIAMAVVSSRPEIRVVNVSANGDVLFVVGMTDLGLCKGDLSHPMLTSRAFVNFVGELLVRRHIREFTTILAGVSAPIYEGMVEMESHVNFGMTVDRDGIVRFQMHISLAEAIIHERYRPHAAPETACVSSSVSEDSSDE